MENIATALIGIGFLMLFQPFALALYTYSFITMPRRHGDVHRRFEVPGVTMAEIRIQNLRKAFGDFVAVQDSNFTVEDGEFFVMLGPSGCGKTTTLRMIAGLELPTGGQILLGGEDVTMLRPRERDIAFVFQLFALYPHMNVRKNIGFPCWRKACRQAEIRARVEETAAAAHRPPARQIRLRALPAATASASRSAAPSCGGRNAS
jgi:ABC-type glutathione transport system ATPase component